MVRKKNSNIRRNLFYIMRGIIRWAVLFAVGFGALCLAVMLMESPDARVILEAALVLFAVLWVGEKFYGKEKQHGKNR